MAYFIGTAILAAGVWLPTIGIDLLAEHLHKREANK